MTETEVVNQAFGRIGSKRITDYQTSNEPGGIVARLHYPQVRDALLRSFDWPFARARKTLSQHTDTPAFEWNYQYELPNDFLKMRADFDQNDLDKPEERWEIEGTYFMTDNDAANIKYIKKVTSVSKFDPLFIEVLILKLSLRFLVPLAGTNTVALRKEIKDELRLVLLTVRAAIGQENNTSGRHDWVNARTQQSQDPAYL
jgi:hypothetical protein